MSVIVKGMEMPKGCEQCCFNGRTKCKKMPIGFDEYPLVGKRPDWCPLAEVPTGHWIQGHSGNRVTLKCDQCNYTSVYKEKPIWKPNFCPNCGADMRGE